MTETRILLELASGALPEFPSRTSVEEDESFLESICCECWIADPSLRPEAHALLHSLEDPHSMSPRPLSPPRSALSSANHGHIVNYATTPDPDPAAQTPISEEGGSNNSQPRSRSPRKTAASELQQPVADVLQQASSIQRSPVVELNDVLMRMKDIHPGAFAAMLQMQQKQLEMQGGAIGGVQLDLKMLQALAIRSLDGSNTVMIQMGRPQSQQRQYVPLEYGKQPLHGALQHASIETTATQHFQPEPRNRARQSLYSMSEVVWVARSSPLVMVSCPNRNPMAESSVALKPPVQSTKQINQLSDYAPRTEFRVPSSMHEGPAPNPYPMNFMQQQQPQQMQANQQAHTETPQQQGPVTGGDADNHVLLWHQMQEQGQASPQVGDRHRLSL